MVDRQSSVAVPAIDMSVGSHRHKVAYEEVQSGGGGGRGFFCFLPCITTTGLSKSSLLYNWTHLSNCNDEKVELSVLSYNLFIRPPGIKNNADDFKSERMEEFIKVMGNYDIIGLQELFSAFSNRQQQLIDAAKRVGFLYHTKPKPHNTFSPFLVDGGLLLLSKYPIVDSDSMIYVQGVQSDALASKGVVYARIQLNESSSSSIHFFLTHTQASYTSSNPYLATKSENIRAQQLKELSSYMKLKMSTHPGPSILLGDLNVNGRKCPANADEDSEEYLKMLSIFQSPDHTICDLLKVHQGGQPVTFGDVFVDSYTDQVKPRETKLTHPEDLCTQQRLDYIFLIESLRGGETEADDSESFVELQRQMRQEGYTSVGVTPKKKKKYFAVKPYSTKVTPFFVGGMPFTQLSDHYGVETTIVYYKNGTYD
eukprot:TRINITY_DN10647_c0_g1_i1.p1 TRINITY_DN10647_c0_g1~~TRINITY_DN10647_c0_g1_i1.p1  ORF type:complete len:425 (+),score=88.98 TRINITY_DN10647_c0_g1_i1:103-1377(+)